MWLLEHAPFDWSPAQASEAVSSIFSEVTMTRQQRTRKGINFYFKGAHTTAHDVVALPFVDGDQTEMMWCRWAPVRSRPQAQTIRTNGSWSLLPPKDPFAETTKVAQDVSQGDDEDSNAADAAIANPSSQTGAPSATETKEAKDAKREAPNKGKGPAKRSCTETRDLPKGLEQQAAPADGNCLFHAASAAIAHVLGSQPEAHSVLRAKVAQHYKKNSERYSLVWDKEIPDRSAAGSFQDYIAAIAQVDTWAGHMELAALARLYDIKFVIFPRSPALEVCAVHVQQRKRVAVLVFTGSHYEWLKPSGKLPQELCDVMTLPPQVPMRGGGKARSHANSSKGSGCSVWTEPSLPPASIAGSVWTLPSRRRDEADNKSRSSVWTAQTQLHRSSSVAQASVAPAVSDTDGDAGCFAASEITAVKTCPPSARSGTGAARV